jgi:hypothetical protein
MEVLMKHRVLVVAAAAGALFAVSCKDDGNSNPVEPQVSNTPSISPNRQQTAPRQPSAAMIKSLVGRTAAVVTTTTNQAVHDPNIRGMPVECVDGAVFAGLPGTSDPFRPQGSAVRGCEVNILNVSGGAAAVATLRDPLRGVKLVNVDAINFDYAGGPQGAGSPRWSIPIDEDGDRVFEFDPDGTETFAFIDNLGCNDGDSFVGRVRGQDDPTCEVTYKSTTYPNWSTFAGAFPNARVGGRFGPSFGNQPADPFIILDASNPSHYLIYHVVLKPK